jgi:hypothetical protein
MKRIENVEKILKLIEQDYRAFVIAAIIYEKEVSYDEALILLQDFMDDDSKTGLLNIED